ncbi:MAG: hypothetical protein KAQ85_01380 [Thermodesulfovibrionia bacterium]|nr:hypothetical protein [Thermodesulfovibrionia bacterium]
MTNGYFWDEGDLDDMSNDDLLKEFDRMLDSIGDKPKPAISKDGCSHSWIFVGKSPVLNEDWFDCKHCAITKEEYEHDLKYY